MGARKGLEDELIKEIEKVPGVGGGLGRTVSGKPKEVSIATTSSHNHS